MIDFTRDELGFPRHLTEEEISSVEMAKDKAKAVAKVLKGITIASVKIKMPYSTNYEIGPGKEAQ